MSVTDRAFEVAAATFPRAWRDRRARPFGLDQHEPYLWRVSGDVWAYLPESEGVIQLGRDATAVMRVHEARGQWQEPGPTEIDRRIDAARGAAIGNSRVRPNTGSVTT